jgi:hypothetical protein
MVARAQFTFAGSRKPEKPTTSPNTAMKIGGKLNVVKQWGILARKEDPPVSLREPSPLFHRRDSAQPRPVVNFLTAPLASTNGVR